MGNVYYLKMNLQFFAEGGEDGGEDKPQGQSVEQRNLSSLELQETLRNVINISEDRGALALEMVNITNATDRIIRERNEFREKYEKKEKELENANQRIGQLYSQVTQVDSLGSQDPTAKIDTQKTLMDLGRK